MNADLPIFITESGIITSLSDEHFQKTHSSISLTLFEILMF